MALLILWNPQVSKQSKTCSCHKREEYNLCNPILFLRIIFISSSTVRLRLPSSALPSAFPNKTVRVFLFLPLQATCLAAVPDLITPVILAWSTIIIILVMHCSQPSCNFLLFKYFSRLPFILHLLSLYFSPAREIKLHTCLKQQTKLCNNLYVSTYKIIGLKIFSHDNCASPNSLPFPVQKELLCSPY